MGSQNFGFMKGLEELLLAGQKKLTNRAISPHRLKCKIGDRMHCFVGLRTPDTKKLFDAIVTERYLWNINDAPKTEQEAQYMDVIDYKHKESIKIQNKERKWHEFALMDGFETYDQFYKYFSNHSKNKKIFILFVFEPILFNVLFREITEYLEV